MLTAAEDVACSWSEASDRVSGSIPGKSEVGSTGSVGCVAVGVVASLHCIESPTTIDAKYLEDR